MLPPILSALATPLPLPLVQRLAQASLDQVLERHPSILDRLGPFADRPIAICPTDAPFEFTLVLARHSVRTARRGSGSRAASTRISGPTAMLLALAEGRLDGDAEVLARHISVEGDQQAALALRNAAKSVSLDFVRDLTPRWGWGHRPARLLLGTLRRSLLRREGLRCS